MLWQRIKCWVAGILSCLLGMAQGLHFRIARRIMNGSTPSKVLLYALIMTNRVELLLMQWLNCLDRRSKYSSTLANSKMRVTIQQFHKARNS